MQIVIYGAGAVGGTMGVRLFQHRDVHGHDIVLIARGEHGAAIRANGLTLTDVDGSHTEPVPVVGHPREIDWSKPSVVVLGMKTQHTEGALDDLEAAVGLDARNVPIVCAQNGVENERIALRRFRNVHGIVVMLPAAIEEPGHIVNWMTPYNGVLDIGRFPSGVDEIDEVMAAAIEASMLRSQPDPAIMRRKYTKLLANLGNALIAACGSDGRRSQLFDRAREEAIACYKAAGIEWASEEEDAERRSFVRIVKLQGARAQMGSTRQSLERGAGTVEVDFLNGEIGLLGRLHGVATPVNDLLRYVATDLARRGAGPGTVAPEQLEAMLAS